MAGVRVYVEFCGFVYKPLSIGPGTQWVWPVVGQVFIEFPCVSSTVLGATLANRRDMVQAFREDESTEGDR